MAHNLTASRTSAGDYLYSCVTARRPAWHELGVNFADRDGLTVEEALREAFQDFVVTTQPLHTTGPDGSPLEVPDRYATVRAHPATGEVAVLGTVGPRYHVLQNRDAYRFAEEILGEGGRVTSAGGLYGDRRTFVTLALPDTITVGGVDEVTVHLVLTNSHDGSTALTTVVTPIRVVCANTERLAMAQAHHRWSARHTASVTHRMDEARRTLHLAKAHSDAFTNAAEALIGRTFTDRDFQAFTAALLPDSGADTKRKAERLQRSRDTMRQLFNEAPTQANIRGTRWAAYNAVTEWADWTPLTGANPDQRRATRTLTDQLGDLKSRAASYLLAA